MADLNLAGQNVTADWWDCSAQVTYSSPSAPVGEWHLQLENVRGFASAAVEGSTVGWIDFGADGKAGFAFRDRPGQSPFVIVRPLGENPGVPLEVRFAATVTAGEHNVTAWTPPSWDEAHAGYVAIGPAADGSLSQADLWGSIEARTSDGSDWIMLSARLGWVDLGPG